MSAPHECEEDLSFCCCRPDGLEPSENCPIHGSGPWPPKCDICGKFMPWESRIQKEQL